ncbi:hypothetical protein HYS10_01020 [Candidatus Collierbacteria bacterium]|nr:hypothetical protein [Candidatus Collierbacteria bacterium]
MTEITIICGTTGSGKTALALKMARDKPTSIISADSRQVYEGLDIITGKDIPEGFIKEESNLFFNSRKVIFYSSPPIRLLGFNLLKPNESFNAAEFVDLTNQIIQKETGGNRQVIIVGGTGFYLKALTQPQTLAQVAPDETLREELSALSVEKLQQRLWEVNPQKFLSLNDSDIKNPRRLTRAIEIGLSPPILNRSNPELVEGEVKYKWLGLRLPLEVLKQKINARVIVRVNSGAVSEVEKLLKEYPDRNLPIYTSLGVKPIIEYLDGKISKEKLIENWTTDEVNYAKRQITWFKKQPQISPILTPEV